MTEHEKRLGFEFEHFNVYDGFDDGFMYYDSHNNCFYTCPNASQSDWWNSETMEITLSCPYCNASVGGFFVADTTFVKKWMGKHLALNHCIEVEKFLLRLEQKEEYAVQ